MAVVAPRGPAAGLTALLGLGLGLALGAAPAHAADPPEDVRTVQLVDGRTYHGEVVTTEPGGVRLRIPQGETLVGFHELKKLSAGTQIGRAHV